MTNKIARREGSFEDILNSYRQAPIKEVTRIKKINFTHRRISCL
jgi:hypothetical protein